MPSGGGASAGGGVTIGPAGGNAGNDEDVGAGGVHTAGVADSGDDIGAAAAWAKLDGPPLTWLGGA